MMSDKAEVLSRPSVGVYATVGMILAATSAAIVTITGHGATPARTDGLLGPVFAMVALTFAVWGLMALVRNLLVFVGTVSIRYFADYATDAPDERYERAARTFNNL